MLIIRHPVRRTRCLMLLSEVFFSDFFFLFLALLDYVSRAHGIAICPSSVVRPSVRRPSSVVRRPSSVRVAIISELNARISFKF